MNLKFENLNKNFEKNFFSEIIASENVSINCLYEEENTCNRQLQVIENSRKKIQQIVFVSEIIASENLGINCLC